MPRPGEEGKPSRDASAAPAPAPQDRKKARFRHVAISKKRLPETEAKHEVFWASVILKVDGRTSLSEENERYVGNIRDRYLICHLAAGERHIKPAGRGVYAICSPTDEALPPSKRDQTCLAYHLSYPSFPGKVQLELGIHLSSSFLLQVKNPDAPPAPQAGINPKKRAAYLSEGKQEAFGEGVAARKFVPADPTTLLDYRGAELLLIGSEKT